MAQGWSDADRIATGWVESGTVSAVGLATGSSDSAVRTLLVGRQSRDQPVGSIRDDALFLVASITKPVVAMAALGLVESGDVGLGDRVSRFLPEFAKAGKHGITLRHLLTHTSGLPDMLPDNRELRERNAALAEFVSGAATAAAEFPPGKGAQYQSMGFAALGAVVEHVTGTTLRAFCRERLFDPLGLERTHLGISDDWFNDGRDAAIVEVDVLAEQADAAEWGWNSRYWRTLGAPWGGLLTTPADLAVFARMMLARGEGPRGRVFAPATVAAATRNQLVGFPDVSESDRRCRGWGFGWRMQWPTHSASFGDLVGPRTYGHFGATGTVLWIDPDLDRYGVVLTTTPFDPRKVQLAHVSNVMAANLDGDG